MCLIQTDSSYDEDTIIIFSCPLIFILPSWPIFYCPLASAIDPYLYLHKTFKHNLFCQILSFTSHNKYIIIMSSTSCLTNLVTEIGTSISIICVDYIIKMQLQNKYGGRYLITGSCFLLVYLNKLYCTLFASKYKHMKIDTLQEQILLFLYYSSTFVTH